MKTGLIGLLPALNDCAMRSNGTLSFWQFAGLIALVAGVIVLASAILLRHAGPCRFKRGGGMQCDLLQASPRVDRVTGDVANNYRSRV